MSHVCCVQLCGSKQGGKNNPRCLFRITPDSSNYIAVLNAIGHHLKPNKSVPKIMYVCDLHYEKSCILTSGIKIWKDGVEVTLPRQKRRLQDNSIPTIFTFQTLTHCKQTLTPTPVKESSVQKIGQAVPENYNQPQNLQIDSEQSDEYCISVDEVPVNETPSSAEVLQDDSETIKIEVFQDDLNIIETEVCQDDSNDNETELVNNNVETEPDKMCRFCMKKTKVAKHIFEDYIDDDEHIYLAVNDCLYPLMVVIEDHLSKYICNECLNTLSRFVEFRDFVLKNDKIQREQLSPLMTWGAPGQKRDTEAEIEPHILKKRKIVHRPEQKNSIVVSGQSKLTNQDTGGKDFSKESFGPDQQNNGDSSLVAPILLSVLHKNVSGEDQGEGTQPKTILQECFKKSDYNAEQDSVPKTAIWVKNLKQSDSKVEASNSSQTTCDNIQFCLANGYLMEHKVLKGNLRYLKCALAKCPALGTQEVLMPGVFANTISITKKHNHEKPTEFDIKKQKFISIIRKRLQNAKGSSIKYIYDEVCQLDPELTQLVPLKELTREICNL